ncbi:dihydrofolate reductase family protein [Streptomyces sp. R302]|uniref:dihydrofolate reductase family protein n=1 Tax=unclassified Streptomyces TaxID=2593676 RepID=UPI00145DD1D0|nr:MULTISPECIES: dihydrofolate reductase family protein [unclassified Streptomyces]NML52545.1 dihydrofolate reductase family protein [Streptomyces sp. R301]NML80526.1 dihydrofolate reductase family protein [Streptomyces sp. R302]
MRKVVSGLFVSLDGAVQSPDQWQFEFDEEMGAALARTLETADTILLGGVTFTEWAGYWPTVTSGEDAGFATWINESPKYVVSSTLDSVDDWANSTLIKGDLTTAVNELKAGEGKDITVAGSPTLVRSLLELDLLDELVLLIHPVVAGEGRRKLFTDDTPMKRLQLVSAQPTSSGVIIATYRPAR